MTTNESEQTALPLPGMTDPEGEAAARAGELAGAVRRSIRALDAAGLVAEHDAARLQLALELADIITIKRRTGRMSTVGNDARVLVDLLDKLLPEQTEVDEQLKSAMAAWSAALADMPGASAPPS
jgi:hypothetical protein